MVALSVHMPDLKCDDTGMQVVEHVTQLRRAIRGSDGMWCEWDEEGGGAGGRGEGEGVDEGEGEGGGGGGGGRVEVG